MAPGWGRVGLFVGQIPDQVYEGIVVTENNFKRDLWVFGANLQSFRMGFMLVPNRSPSRTYVSWEGTLATKVCQ